MAIIEQEKRIEKYDGDNVLQHVEVEKSTSTFRKSSEEGEFFKIYFKAMDILVGLPEHSLKLLLVMAKEASYANSGDRNNFGGQLVSARKDVKKRWAREFDISERSIYSNLKILIDKGCVRKIDAQTYQINPYIIGRGLQSFSPSRGYGGIVELRKSFDDGVVARDSQVTSDIEIKSMLEEEMASLRKNLKSSDGREQKNIEHQLASLEYEARKLSDDGYTMSTAYRKLNGE